MNEQARKVREDLEKKTREFESAKTALEELEKNCHHKYGQVVYDPIHTKAYTIPGDPPGVGGSDHQFSCYVPAKTEKRWRRECNLCGLVEYTTRVKEKVEELPEWSDDGGFRR